MGRWIVKEPCKAGPGLYLQPGQIVDLSMPEFQGMSSTLVAMAERGLLEAYDSEKLEKPEPDLVVEELQNDEDKEAQETGETVLEVEDEDKPDENAGKSHHAKPKSHGKK